MKAWYTLLHMRSSSLQPYDVAVALRLLDGSDASYPTLARELGLGQSTVHGSVRRLDVAGLVRTSADGARRVVNRRALLNFLEHGVKYAFPGVLGPITRGVPTAHAGPVLADVVAADTPVVWPEASGSAEGAGLEPLLPEAAALAGRAPHTYALLTAVDALRVGRAREQRLASAYLREQLAV